MSLKGTLAPFDKSVHTMLILKLISSPVDSEKKLYVPPRSASQGLSPCQFIDCLNLGVQVQSYKGLLIVKFIPERQDHHSLPLHRILDELLRLKPIYKLLNA